jgi:hypothetical protein
MWNVPSLATSWECLPSIDCYYLATTKTEPDAEVGAAHNVSIFQTFSGGIVFLLAFTIYHPKKGIPFSLN